MEIGCENMSSIELVLGRVHWRAFMCKVMNLPDTLNRTLNDLLN
jgi:hypothetical protein